VRIGFLAVSAEGVELGLGNSQHEEFEIGNLRI
jgi:hypothetical protein